VKLLYAAALMLMMSAVAMAAPDSQQFGPYMVSFDLDADYQVQVAEPMESEIGTVYSIALFIDNSTGASIAVAEYAEQTDATLNMHKTLNTMSLMLQGFNSTDVQDMTIDGKDGFLITAEPFQAAAEAPSNIYKAMYWMDSEDFGPVSAGTTSVTITSTYPSDVTEGLLSSLSIAKGEAPAMATANGGQVFPPE